MEEVAKGVILSRGGPLNANKRVVGLDTTILVDMVLSPQFCDYVLRSFRDSDLLHTHKICAEMEAVSVLVNKYGFTPKKAKTEIKSLVRKLDLKMIGFIKGIPNPEDVLKLAQAARIKNFNPPDNIILSNWKKYGVNVVYSTDGPFIEVAKLLGFNARLVPPKDIVKIRIERESSKKISKFFGQFKKKKPKFYRRR